MNTSFNLVLNQNVEASEVLFAISNVTDKKAIVNGPAWINTLSEDLVQMITILDCTKVEFNKMKRSPALKSFFVDKVAY